MHLVTLLSARDAPLGIGVSLAQLTAHEETKVIANVYNSATGCEVPEPEVKIVPADDDAEVHDTELVNDELGNDETSPVANG